MAALGEDMEDMGAMVVATVMTTGMDGLRTTSMGIGNLGANEGIRCTRAIQGLALPGADADAILLGITMKMVAKLTCQSRSRSLRKSH